MLLSELLSRLTHGLDYMKADDIILAVGAPNGGWRPFSSIMMGQDDANAVAVIEIGEGRYWEAGVSTSSFRGVAEDFIRDHGDVNVVVSFDGLLHSRLDLNVDQDVGKDGEQYNVAIVQAYTARPAMGPR